MSNDNLPAAVRAERKRRGWTQAQLAEKAGVALRTYQMFETNRAQPQGANLRAILNAVDLTPDDDDTATATRSSWPPHVQVYLDMLGAYLVTFPEEEQLEIIAADTRRIFENRASKAHLSNS